MSTKMKVNKTFDVVNGPSVDRLFDACKYAYGTNIPIEFDVAAGYTAPKNDPGCAYVPLPMRNVRIVGIEHEDGSGCSFNIRGYCDADLRFPFKCGPKLLYVRYCVKIYYNSKTRKGHITFIQ